MVITNRSAIFIISMQFSIISWLQGIATIFFSSITFIDIQGLLDLTSIITQIKIALALIALLRLKWKYGHIERTVKVSRMYPKCIFWTPHTTIETIIWACRKGYLFVICCILFYIYLCLYVWVCYLSFPFRFYFIFIFRYPPSLSFYVYSY